MTIFDRITELLPDFSKNERRIADHILKYPHDLERYTSINIADVCNVSRSAVIRFCQKLGFTGFADFRTAVLSESETSGPKTASSGSAALDVYRSCIDQMREQTDRTELAAVADLMVHARRILCYGQDHSRYSAEQMAFRLERTHIDATFTGDASVTRNYESILGSGDMLVIFSISGQKSFAEMLDTFRAKRVSVILFTMNVNTSLAGHADHVLYLPSAAHSDSDHLLDDAICFFLAIEMVIESIHGKLK